MLSFLILTYLFIINNFKHEVVFLFAEIDTCNILSKILLSSMHICLVCLKVVRRVQKFVWTVPSPEVTFWATYMEIWTLGQFDHLTFDNSLYLEIRDYIRIPTKKKISTVIAICRETCRIRTIVKNTILGQNTKIHMMFPTHDIT